MRVGASSVALSIGLALATAALASPARAQVFFRPFAHGFSYEVDRPFYGPPPAPDEAPLSPREIMRAARDQGFVPLARPVRNRDVYVLEAQDQYGRGVRLIMDAYEGTIVRRFEARRSAPPAPAIRREAQPWEPEQAQPWERRQARPPRSNAPRQSARPPRPSEGPRVIEGVGPPSAPPSPDAQRERPSPRVQTPTRRERPVPPPSASPAHPPMSVPPRGQDAPQAEPPRSSAPGAEVPSAIPPPPIVSAPPVPAQRAPTPQAPASPVPSSSQAPAQQPPGAAQQPSGAAQRISGPPAQASAPPSAPPPVAPLDDALPRKAPTPSVPAVTLE
jgi:hypothetical protein